MRVAVIGGSALETGFPCGFHSTEFPERENEHPHLLQTQCFSPISAGPFPSDISSCSSVSLFLTQMDCQKRPSGHLVSILSAVEASFVASLVKNSAHSYSYVWIGLNDPTQVRLLFLLLFPLKLLWPSRSAPWPIHLPRKYPREPGSLDIQWSFQGKGRTSKKAE